MQQHFRANSAANLSADESDKKLLMLNSALALSHLNPLSSLGDQVTPVSLKLSEKYQNLLQDYCSQPLEDFICSQFYLCLLILLLVVFSIANKRRARAEQFARSLESKSCSASKMRRRRSRKQKKARRRRSSERPQVVDASHYLITSGKLLASQHETNELQQRASILDDDDDADDADENNDFVNGAETFAEHSKHASKLNDSKTIGNVFVVTLFCAPIYFGSIVLHVHGQEAWALNHELVSSLAMVLIAFVTLLGIFVPILTSARSREKLAEPQGHAHGSPGSPGDQLLVGSVKFAHQRQRQLGPGSSGPSSQPGPFAMFPEFTPNGLRRPASLSGDSGSSRPAAGFAHAKESRRKLGAALATLGPSAADSLRSMGVYGHGQPGMDEPELVHQQRAPARRRSALCADGDQLDEVRSMARHSAALSCNLEPPASGQNSDGHLCPARQQAHHSQLAKQAHSNGGGEKRLIVLDVDPSCPRHGVAAAAAAAVWAHRTGVPSADLKGCGA